MRNRCLKAVLLLLTSFAAAQSRITERLQVDATDAPRNILHSTLTIPLTPAIQVSSGSITLTYPKWIPGNHRPTGPIQNLLGLHIKANGQELEWHRDLRDMYAFHIQVPAGTKEIEATYDTVTYNGKSSAASSKVLDLLWNQVVLYPQDAATDDVQMTATIRLPEGWKFGTALTPIRQSASSADFQPVSLTRLVDSPLIAGANYRQVQLTKPGESPATVIDMVGESEASIQITDKDLASYKQLVAETGKLFGSRHYEKYHFLLTLSNQTAHHGLEHHESSDNGTSEENFSDPDWHNLEADLLPHEFVHSWNGKYRRPAGLATPNYQIPMEGDLLWVYEGLTDYLGDILSARTGLRSPQEWRENAAYTGAMLDHRAGRTWRPLQDAATSVQILFTAPPEWVNWRRSADYYPEGFLIWLEVDTLIRQQTHGQKSLNDFCRLFFGGQSGPPAVVPYKFEDVAAALNQVAPYNWAEHLRQRLDSKPPHAPLGGFEHGGWKLVYTEEKNTTMDAREKTSEALDLSFSLGIIVSNDGALVDVIPGSPAYLAGAGPGMKLIGVNGRKYSKDVMRTVIHASLTNQQPIALLVENGEYYSTLQVNYHGGNRYPHLVRNEGQPDLLGEIIKPLAQ
ncbi:MAG TPA: M61 family peptidase [Candidatus Angelobacter sp.]|jgi:predicted metalloprotease with PDZ domain|nr:M61 family peptidase [Candidatus Angelobacter sp.]